MRVRATSAVIPSTQRQTRQAPPKECGIFIVSLTLYISATTHSPQQSVSYRSLRLPQFRGAIPNQTRDKKYLPQSGTQSCCSPLPTTNSVASWRPSLSRVQSLSQRRTDRSSSIPHPPFPSPHRFPRQSRCLHLLARARVHH